MIHTGRFNKITGEKIMQAEATDVNWSKDWEELNDEEKVMFLSFRNVQYYSDLNKNVVIAMFNYYKQKYIK